MPRKKVVETTVSAPAPVAAAPMVVAPAKNYNSFLVAGLLIVTFLLGMAVMKIQTLGNNNTSNSNAAAQAAPSGSAAQPPLAKQNVANGHLPVLGNKDAKVTIVEFSDFQCPFCHQLFTDVLGQLKTEYINTGKAKLYYRHYPLPFHANAEKGAEASECANEQGKFWDMHDQLFTNQDAWANQAAADAAATFNTYASTLGLDTQKFSDCLTSGRYAQVIKDDATAGTNAKVDGTPTTFIDGQPVVGALPYSAFKTIIDQELSKK